MSESVPEAGFLANVLSKIEALERAAKLDHETISNLQRDVVQLERQAEERDAIIHALRVTARGAS